MLAALLLVAAAPPIAIADVPLRPGRTYDGIWLDGFESSRFFPGARAASELDWRAARIWLQIDRDAARVRAGPTAKGDLRARTNLQGYLYHVRFRGRAARDMDCPNGQKRSGSPRVVLCYGHMGASAGLIVVDRIEQITPLGPLPLH